MFSKIKTKLNSLGFAKGHYGMIAFTVAAVVMLSFIQGPLTLENLFKFQFTQADLEQDIEMSVQEAILKAESEVPGVSYESNEKVAEFKREQLSLLDPSFGEGSVLGLSTEAQASIDHILSNETVNQIPINAVPDSEKSLEEYVSKSKVIESYYGSLELLGILSTQDRAAVAKTLPYYQSIIGELQQLPVPQTLSRYHRVKLLYYTTIMTMASNVAGDANTEDRSAAGILFFEIGNELETLKLQLGQQLGVAL